jgi:acid phosphatase (class A)
MTRTVFAPWILLAGFALPGNQAHAQGAAIAPKYLVATKIYLDGATLDLHALPEPPQRGSLAAQADLETILQVQAWRTEAEVAWAKQVDHLDAFDAASIIGPWFTRERVPRCARLLDEALGDGEGANYAAKLKFKRLRPPFQDPRVKPVTPVQEPTGATPPASFYSYPSGHATSIYLLAELLGDLVPAKAEAISSWAHRAAWSRMIAGVHFPSDDVGGQFLAAIVVRALRANQAFQKALAGCREELRAIQAAQTPALP